MSLFELMFNVFFGLIDFVISLFPVISIPVDFFNTLGWFIVAFSKYSFIIPFVTIYNCIWFLLAIWGLDLLIKWRLFVLSFIPFLSRNQTTVIVQK